MMDWNKIRIVSFVSSTILIIIASIYLPEKIITNNDKNIVGNIKVEDTNKIESIRQKSTLFENIELLQKDYLVTESGDYSEKESEKMTIDVGENIKNEQEAIRICKEQIEELQEFGFPVLEQSGKKTESASGNLIIDSENPSKYVIIWEVEIKSEYGKGVFYLEDQYQKIVSLDWTSGEEQLLYDLMEIAENWGDYIGVNSYDLKYSVEPIVKKKYTYGEVTGVYKGESDEEYYLFYQFTGYDDFISINYTY